MISKSTIAKNTLFLYVRMLITMGVGIITSRLVINALGIVDYGLYGLVGGLVGIFTFLNFALSAATQRYLSVEIGRNNYVQLQRTFNASINIHFIIGIIILILAETVGLWFVNFKLVIPQDRIFAANIVYQFSVFSSFLSIIQSPYNALLIARERMSVYAYISIAEVFFKLIIVLILVKIETDKLILYAFLTFVVSIIIRFLYRWYCHKHFKESVYLFYYDKNFYKEIISYSGWNLFGNLAFVSQTQGSNILLNLFFGAFANAAYGITTMVQGIVVNFISNFQVSVNPQIMKNYSKGNHKESWQLMLLSAKASFFAMLIIIFPVIINLNLLLLVWLKKIPELTVDFVKYALIYSLMDTVSNPLMTGLQATGKIKMYQLVVGIIGILHFPLSYVFFTFTHNPYTLYASFFIVGIVSLLLRLFFVRKQMNVRISDFFDQVIKRILFVIIILYVLYFLFGKYFIEKENFFYLIIKSIIIIFIIVGIIFLVGINRKEKIKIIEIFQNKFSIKK